MVGQFPLPPVRDRILLRVEHYRSEMFNLHFPSILGFAGISLEYKQTSVPSVQVHAGWQDLFP